jgi:hypothetical protein
MQRTFIISLLLVLALLASGCNSAPKNEPPPATDDEPALILDKYGFEIMDLNGFTEDKTSSSIGWNVLTLNAEDVRVQFGFIKGAKIMSEIPGMPAPSERQTLYDWAMGMLLAPKFYPATTKSILSNDYLEVDGRNAMILNILLELDVAEYAKLSGPILKTNGAELDFLNKHKICILKIYLIFRGRDIFHVEVFTDPLNYLIVQKKFDKLVTEDLKFSDMVETPSKS